MRPSHIVVAALLALTAACGDGTGPGPDGVSGSLSFSHSGATTGTFSASGSIPITDPEAATWAVAARDDLDQSITIVANVARPSNTFDDIIIYFPQLTPGTLSIATDADVFITFGQTQSGLAAWACSLFSGSVVVTSVSNSRVRGTFSGSGDCLGAAGVNPVAFSVTNGSFDVALVDVPF